MTKPAGTTLGIIGLGQIGGSLAAALESREQARRIVGYDTNAALLQEAVRRGLIDEATRGTAELIDRVNVVILATPIGAIIEIIKDQTARLKDKLLVTDTGSLMQPVTKFAGRAGLSSFVAGHPLAGTEKRGPESWNAGLFRGANYFYVSDSRANDSALALMRQLISASGAKAIPIDAAEHDKIFSVTSNLPHLLACSLKHVFDDLPIDRQSKQNLKGPSFGDATRVSASDPEMVIQMLWHNRNHLSPALGAMLDRLQAAQEALDSDDENRFRQLFEAD
jgi:prephenate dehydrogenase